MDASGVASLQGPSELILEEAVVCETEEVEASSGKYTVSCTQSALGDVSLCHLKECEGSPDESRHPRRHLVTPLVGVLDRRDLE